MIFNPLGITSGAQILAKSIHVVMTNRYISIALLTNSQNDEYYQHVFDTPIPLDGVTENTVVMEVNNNTVTLTVNGTSYTDSFTHTLTDYYSRYALFEFFCLGNRDIQAMPQYTYMKLEDNHGNVISDDFHRSDGLLTVTPDGHPYSVYT